MCRQLGVARSSFYAWRARAGTITATQARRDALKPEIQRVFTFLRGVGGCRRVTAKLNEEGIICSVGLVADLMREMGLAAVQQRAYRRTTVPDEHAQVFDDHLDRNFDPADYSPGQALVSDITYLRTGQGWLYLATIIDLATRMVIGWQLAEHMRTSLVLDALDMARTHGRVAEGALLHSDHGTQGGFNWSSQHLEHGGVWWDARRRSIQRSQQTRGGSGQLIERCVRRCDLLGGLNRLERCSVNFGG